MDMVAKCSTQLKQHSPLWCNNVYMQEQAPYMLCCSQPRASTCMICLLSAWQVCVGLSIISSCHNCCNNIISCPGPSMGLVHSTWAFNTASSVDRQHPTDAFINTRGRSYTTSAACSLWPVAQAAAIANSLHTSHAVTKAYVKCRAAAASQGLTSLCLQELFQPVPSSLSFSAAKCSVKGQTSKHAQSSSR